MVKKNYSLMVVKCKFIFIHNERTYSYIGLLELQSVGVYHNIDIVIIPTLWIPHINCYRYYSYSMDPHIKNCDLV